MTLVEILVVMLICAGALAIGFQSFVVIKTGYEATFNSNAATADARKALTTLADHVRNAQRCSATTGCVANSVVGSASSTSFTYYTDTAGTSVTYLLSGTSLIRRVGGTDTTVINNVSGLTMSYYKSTTYNGTWTAVASPTTAELPYVCGVKIVARCSQGGTPFQVETTIRLRNAPKKSTLTGH